MGKVGVGKKKNKGVGVDFKRVKHKVGKRLAKARNETNVNFKAHTISLPSQALLQQDRDGLSVNSQNLSLQELLIQTGHYSEKVRKQALVGLADLFTRHPNELRQHAHLALTKIAERVGDGDAAVRLALRTLLREQALPNLDPGMVRPFMPILMAHISSAMTNLNMEVRLDALNFIDVLMDFVPELVVNGFQAPCLLHFCDLLSTAHRGRTIKSQSITSLLKVISALNSYLRRAYPAVTGIGAAAAPLGSDAPQEQQQQQQQQHGSGKGVQTTAPASSGPGSSLQCSSMAQDRALMHDRAAWPVRGASFAGGSMSLPLACRVPCLGSGAAPLPAATNQAPGGRGAGGHLPGSSAAAARPLPASGAAGKEGADGSYSAAVSSSAPDVQALARRLVVLLFECWSECGPSKAVEGPDVEPLQILSGILSATFTLETAVLLRAGNTARDARSALSAPTPAQASPAAGAADLEAQWLSGVALGRVAPVFPAAVPPVKPSPALCDALVHFNLQSSQLLALLLPSATMSKAPWVQALLEFYVGVMERSEFLPARGMLSEAVAGAGAATNAAYLSVLRGVAAALHAPGAADAATGRLITALESLTARMPARSPVHAACLRLQHGLMKACRHGQLFIPASSIARWVQPLPRLLWELGDGSPQVSKLALCMLHDVARFAGPDTPLHSSLTELQSQLGPLFCLHMPARKQQQQQQLPGSCPACVAERASAEARVAVAGRAPGSCGAAADAAAPLLLVPGPVSKLPLDVQLLAIDLVYHLGRLEAPLLKALAPAIHDARVLASDATALRLLELTLARMAAMEPATAASWVLTLLFSTGLPPGSPAPAQPGRGAGAAAAAWQRQRQLVERTCAALPSWAPVHLVLQLLEPQLKVLLAAGSAGLTDQQRYSMIQLASLLPGGPPASSAGDVRGAGGDEAGGGGGGGFGELQKSSVAAVLPAACLDFYASRVEEEQQQQAAGPGGAAAAAAAAAAAVPGAAAAAAVLRLVEAHGELLVPVAKACAAAAAGPASAAAGAAQHGAECRRTRFCAGAALLQQLLRCRALGPAVLRQQEAVRGSAAALVERAQRSPALSGDARCRAEAKQLSQVVVDVFGPA